MTKKIVIRDKSGAVINIGPWDYMVETIVNSETGEMEDVFHNPFPDGATESEEDVVILNDGGIGAKNP